MSMQTIPSASVHEPIRLVVITGLSGSGKSTAIRALEDIGFFCIDNLPVVLLPKLVELFPSASQEIERIALVLDAREGRFLTGFEHNIERVRAAGSRVEVLFLECSDEQLLRRYSETRRRHPLAPEGRPEEGMERERRLMAPLRALADEVLDTSNLTPHELRRLLQQRYTRPSEGQQMTLWLISFGFKFGLPVGAHLVFDARFLRNPYFQEELRPRDGRDPAVAEYVMADGEAESFLQRVQDFIERFRPAYDREGKSHLACAIGCTGGRHRSVVLVERLAERLAGPLRVHHRDVDRSS